MSNFTLQELYKNVIEMCMPAALRSQKSKLKIIEDLTREKAVHNLKIAEMNKRAVQFRVEARACLKGKTRSEANEAAARNKLRETRRCMESAEKRLKLVALIDDSIFRLDDEASTSSTFRLIESVHRDHGTDAKTIDKMEDVLSRFQEIQQDAEDMRMALDGGLKDNNQDDLERELQMLIDDVHAESVADLPALDQVLDAHVIGTPVSRPVGVRNENGVLRRGAPGPDGQPISA